jgi:hypothetical protein
MRLRAKSVSGHSSGGHPCDFRAGLIEEAHGAVLIDPSVFVFSQLTRDFSGVDRSIADGWETLSRLVVKRQVLTLDREEVPLHGVKPCAGVRNNILPAPRLRPVGIRDSHLSLIVIQALDGPIRFD